MGNRLPAVFAVRQRLVDGNQPDGLLPEPERTIEGPGASVRRAGVEFDTEAEPGGPCGHAGQQETADALPLDLRRDDQLAEVAARLSGPVLAPRRAGEPDHAGGRLGDEDDPIVPGWCGQVVGYPTLDGGSDAVGIEPGSRADGQSARERVDGFVVICVRGPDHHVREPDRTRSGQPFCGRAKKSGMPMYPMETIRTTSPVWGALISIPLPR